MKPETSPKQAKTVLHVEDLSMQFGGVLAVNNLSLEVRQGEIVALIGPNGAGKTTAFNAITGVYAPSNGRISFEGETIAEAFPQGKLKKMYAGSNASKYSRQLHLTPDKITAKGIARTFQNIRLFKNLTVFENVIIAQHQRMAAGLLRSSFHLNKAEEQQMRERSWALLELVDLADLAQEKASNLPYGKQRHLEIARALATKPRLLLLDEPAAGMNPQETDELSAFIQQIKEQFALTVFVIEHHMNLVMSISDRIYVIDFGKLIAQGDPKTIQADPAVITAYLGVEA